MLCFYRPSCSVEGDLVRELRGLQPVLAGGLQEKELKVINPAVAFT